MKTSYLINVLDEKSKLKISITHSPNFHFHNLSLDLNKSNMTGATSEEGTVYISILSEHPIHPRFFLCGSCCYFFNFLCTRNVKFRGSLFVFFSVLFLLVIVLSVILRFTASDYPFGIFKLSFQKINMIYK
jgi:hypothetical protein